MIAALSLLHKRRRHMSDQHHRDHGPITEGKLVRAVHILADIVEEHGAAFRPLYQDMRQQLAELCLQQQAKAAADARAAQSGSQVA
jgi:hypothetical protein